MTLLLTLPAETRQKLAERAALAGKDVETIACELIERGINGSPTIDEILAPFRRQVAASGITDDELTALFEEARNEVHQSREARK